MPGTWAGTIIKETDAEWAPGVTDGAGSGRLLGPRLDSGSALGGAHSLQAPGSPKQGQLVGGDVGVEEGEALQDALHQALGGRMLPASSAGLRAGRQTDRRPGFSGARAGGHVPRALPKGPCHPGCGA